MALKSPCAPSGTPTLAAKSTAFGCSVLTTVAPMKCASFCLIAAEAIEKLGIPPLPIPTATMHFPLWSEYCKAHERLASRAGTPMDLSDAVPYGLESVDGDAVDPCTRAWLELLRMRSSAFATSAQGTSYFGGHTCATISGTIEDVCNASAVYCTLRARDEIATRLASVAIPVPQQSADKVDPALRSKVRTERVLPLLQAKRWTRSKWASKAGVSKNCAYGYLEGERNLSIDNRRALAEVLDLEPDDLPE